MKKTLLSISVIMLFITLSLNAQIKLNSNNEVGIGGEPISGNRLFVYGMTFSSKLGCGTGYIPNSPYSFWVAGNSLFNGTVDFLQGKIDLGSETGPGKMYLGTTGSFGSANGFRFNPNSAYNGLILESGTSESGGFYADGDFAVIWSPGDQNRLLRVYDEDGMIEKWFIDGNGISSEHSDLRAKENIRSLNNSSDILRKLRGVTYNYIKDAPNTANNSNNNVSMKNYTVEYDTIINLENDSISLIPRYHDKQSNTPEVKSATKPIKYIGFIAQEVESIVPELVSENDQGQKFINYHGFIPIIIKSVQEQQDIIEKQKSDIQKLNEKIDKLSKALERLLGAESLSLNQ